MGFNKLYLPDLKEIKERFKNDPESTKRWITKADAIIGPVDSVRYVEHMLNEKNTKTKRVHKRQGPRDSEEGQEDVLRSLGQRQDNFQPEAGGHDV